MNENMVCAAYLSRLKYVKDLRKIFGLRLRITSLWVWWEASKGLWSTYGHYYQSVWMKLLISVTSLFWNLHGGKKWQNCTSWNRQKDRITYINLGLYWSNQKLQKTTCYGPPFHPYTTFELPVFDKSVRISMLIASTTHLTLLKNLTNKVTVCSSRASPSYYSSNLIKSCYWPSLDRI